MKIDEKNLYITKVVEDNNKWYYELRIEYPDKSRNFLHWDDEGRTQDLNELINTKTTILSFDNEINEETCRAIDDGTYYRIEAPITIPTYKSGIEVTFHSRKLNLNDVVSERIYLLVSTKHSDIKVGN